MTPFRNFSENSSDLETCSVPYNPLNNIQSSVSLSVSLSNYAIVTQTWILIIIAISILSNPPLQNIPPKKIIIKHCCKYVQINPNQHFHPCVEQEEAAHWFSDGSDNYLLSFFSNKTFSNQIQSSPYRREKYI